MTDLAVGTRGVDYSWARPDLDALWGAGYRFALRYLSQDTTGKNISVAEARALWQRGFGLGLMYEDEATQALGGAARGQADAARAIAQARVVGYVGVIIFNLGDFKATSDQIAAIIAYYDAAVAACRASGYGYGGYATAYIIEQIAAQGRIGFFFENAMDDAGVSGSTVVSQAAIYQRTALTLPQVGAGGYDEDVLVKSGFPFCYGASGSPAPPVPVPAPNPTPVPQPAPAPAQVAPAYPLGASDWYGPPSKNTHNHSGYYWPADRAGISQFQTRLAQRGWHIQVTGVMDAQTESIVKQFQAEKHLGVDGLVGPATWNAIWISPVT